MSITEYDCFLFLALFIQHGMRMRHIVMWPAPLFNIFPHYLINGNISEEKVIERKTFILIFSTIIVWTISQSKKNWPRFNWKKIFIGLHVKRPLILSHLNETLNFSTDFRKIPISNFMKMHSVRAELFHVDGQTEGQTDRRDEANSRLSQFCERN